MNAIIGNTDGLLYKDNNYYHYDSVAGVRTYLPWDLDTTMRSSVKLVGGSVPGGTKVFTDVLFAHWQSDYLAIASEILAERITLERVTAELERAQRVAGPALDADPALGGDAASATAELQAWWEQRLVELAAELP